MEMTPSPDSTAPEAAWTIREVRDIEHCYQQLYRGERYICTLDGILAPEECDEVLASLNATRQESGEDSKRLAEVQTTIDVQHRLIKSAEQRGIDKAKEELEALISEHHGELGFWGRSAARLTNKLAEAKLEGAADKARLDHLIQQAVYPGTQEPWILGENEVSLAVGDHVEWEDKEKALFTVRAAIDSAMSRKEGAQP